MSGRSDQRGQLKVLDKSKAAEPESDEPVLRGGKNRKSPSGKSDLGSDSDPGSDLGKVQQEQGRHRKQSRGVRRHSDDTGDGASHRNGTLGKSDERARSGPFIRLLRIVLKTVLPIAVIAGAVAGFIYLKSTAPEAKKRPKKERSYSVYTITAQPRDHRPMLKLFGTTTSGRSVDIRALVAGQVMATGPQLLEGGAVDEGDLLLSIDTFAYERAKLEAQAQTDEARARLREQQASLASDKATLKYSRKRLKLSAKDLERAVPLARRGTVSNRTVDDRRNIVIQRQQTVEQLENNIRVWEARIGQQRAAIARLASVAERAARKVKETRLVAPFDAYVTQVGAQVGRIISANDKVATLIDRNWIEVRFTLTDAQFGRIVAAEKTLKGRKVKVAWKVGTKPLVYPATIERVGARISADSGGIEVYARIDDPLHPVSLRPGAFTQIMVPDAEFSKVYRLPGAVLYNGNTVYAVVDGRLAARAVKQVGTAGDEVLLSGGIQPGDHIIATRLSTPGVGLLVTELEKGKGPVKKGSGKKGSRNRAGQNQENPKRGSPATSRDSQPQKPGKEP